MDEPAPVAVEADQPASADPAAQGPIGYALAAIKIAQLDSETIVRISRDPVALGYGAVILAGTNVLAVLAVTVLLGLPWNVLSIIVAPVSALVSSALTTGLVHLAAKALFGATGNYVGLLRVLWLGSFVSLLVLVPFVGPLAGGLWSLLITMVTFQEVDGIERLQALGLSLGMAFVLYLLSSLVAR